MASRGQGSQHDGDLDVVFELWRGFGGRQLGRGTQRGRGEPSGMHRHHQKPEKREYGRHADGHQADPVQQHTPSVRWRILLDCVDRNPERNCLADCR